MVKIRYMNFEKKQAMLTLVHAIRIGRNDLSYIARKLDSLKVPMWKQNYIANQSKTTNRYGSDIVKEAYFKQKP